MKIDNPLHADFDYKEAYPIPEVEAEDFKHFAKIISGVVGDDKGDVFSKLLLWVRCGIPSRLAVLGLDDHSAMIFANCMLEYQVKAVTGLTLEQIAEAIPESFGLNARALLLSCDFLDRLCVNFDFIAGVIEILLYPDPNLEACITVIDEIAQATGDAIEADLDVNPYANEKIYEAVKAKWA
jgi:hypothetical protein